MSPRLLCMCSNYGAISAVSSDLKLKGQCKIKLLNWGLHTIVYLPYLPPSRTNLSISAVSKMLLGEKSVQIYVGYYLLTLVEIIAQPYQNRAEEWSGTLLFVM